MKGARSCLYNSMSWVFGTSVESKHDKGFINALSVVKESSHHGSILYLRLMWAQTYVCGLVANNVGPVADNVVSDGCLFANNLGRKRLCLQAQPFIIVGRYR